MKNPSTVLLFTVPGNLINSYSRTVYTNVNKVHSSLLSRPLIIYLEKQMQMLLIKNGKCSVKNKCEIKVGIKRKTVNLVVIEVAEREHRCQGMLFKRRDAELSSDCPALELLNIHIS